MAQVDDDFTTRELWLLRDVLTFVMRYCGTEYAAENLLLDFAERGHFDKRFRWHHSGDEHPYEVVPSRWGKSDLDFGIEVLVEWPDSCVLVRHTKGDPSGPARVLQRLLSDYGLPPDGYRMHLVRLHRDDVLSMLRLAGLLSIEAPEEAPIEAPEEAPIEEAPIEAPEEAPIEAPEEASVEAPEEAPVDTKRLRRRRSRGRPQFELACEALRAEFPPEGQAPRSVLLKAIGQRVADYVKAKNKAEGLSRKIPNDDLIAEAVEHLGQS